MPGSYLQLQKMNQVQPLERAGIQVTGAPPPRLEEAEHWLLSRLYKGSRV